MLSAPCMWANLKVFVCELLPSRCIYWRKSMQQSGICWILEKCGARRWLPASSCGAKLKCSHLWHHYCISGVTIRLLTPLFAKSGGKKTPKTGSVTLSELSAAPILFSWPELEDWQRCSHGPGHRIWYVSDNNCTIFYPTWHGGGCA